MACFRDIFSLLPIHVGMILIIHVKGQFAKATPHTRGDDPN